jgi:hypothetical protein
VPKAQAKPEALKSPLTDEMRRALARIAKVHEGMDQELIDEAVEALHRDIARYDPKAFIPLAISDLMRLAPRDTQTRALLRRALANGWLPAELARALLIKAGDTPGPHVKALIKAIDDRDPAVRAGAVEMVGGLHAAGAEALPKLRRIMADAKADPNDYVRAYSSTTEMPLHVRAFFAIARIESALKDGKARD